MLSAFSNSYTVSLECNRSHVILETISIINSSIYQSAEQFFLSLRLLRVVHRPKYKVAFSIDYRKLISHARGVYPTQYTSPMETLRVTQVKEQIPE